MTTTKKSDSVIAAEQMGLDFRGVYESSDPMVGFEHDLRKRVLDCRARLACALQGLAENVARAQAELTRGHRVHSPLGTSLTADVQDYVAKLAMAEEVLRNLLDSRAAAAAAPVAR
jgi:hypothetical protein